MSLTYDATGRKWKKDGEFGEVEYDGGVEYRDGVLEAIYTPTAAWWRNTRPIATAPKAISAVL